MLFINEITCSNFIFGLHTEFWTDSIKQASEDETSFSAYIENGKYKFTYKVRSGLLIKSITSA